MEVVLKIELLIQAVASGCSGEGSNDQIHHSMLRSITEARLRAPAKLGQVAGSASAPGPPSEIGGLESRDHLLARAGSAYTGTSGTARAHSDRLRAEILAIPENPGSPEGARQLADHMRTNQPPAWRSARVTVVPTYRLRSREPHRQARLDGDSAAGLSPTWVTNRVTITLDSSIRPWTSGDRTPQLMSDNTKARAPDNAPWHGGGLLGSIPSRAAAPDPRLWARPSLSDHPAACAAHAIPSMKPTRKRPRTPVCSATFSVSS